VIAAQAFHLCKTVFSEGVRLGGGMAAFHLTSTSYHYLAKSPMMMNIYNSFAKQW